MRTIPPSPMPPQPSRMKISPRIGTGRSEPRLRLTCLATSSGESSRPKRCNLGTAQGVPLHHGLTYIALRRLATERVSKSDAGGGEGQGCLLRRLGYGRYPINHQICSPVLALSFRILADETDPFSATLLGGLSPIRVIARRVSPPQPHYLAAP